MEQDKADALISGIAQNAFEVEYVATMQAEEVPNPYRTVEVNGKMQTAGFTQKISEDEVLEGRVLVRRRRAAAVIARVDGGGLGLRRITEIQRPKIGRLKFDRHSAVLIIELENA